VFLLETITIQTGDEGYQWFVDNLGGTWVKTSYNGTIRKNFAGIGYTYDEERDAFIPPKISPYAVLDEETCTWVVPQEPLREDSVWKLVEDENGSRLVPKDGIHYLYSHFLLGHLTKRLTHG
jgi:hypothetical protein